MEIPTRPKLYHNFVTVYCSPHTIQWFRSNGKWYKNLPIVIVDTLSPSCLPYTAEESRGAFRHATFECLVLHSFSVLEVPFMRRPFLCITSLDTRNAFEGTEDRMIKICTLNKDLARARNRTLWLYNA